MLDSYIRLFLKALSIILHFPYVGFRSFLATLFRRSKKTTCGKSWGLLWKLYYSYFRKYFPGNACNSAVCNILNHRCLSIILLRLGPIFCLIRPLQDGGHLRFVFRNDINFTCRFFASGKLISLNNYICDLFPRATEMCSYRRKRKLVQSIKYDKPAFCTLSQNWVLVTELIKFRYYFRWKNTCFWFDFVRNYEVFLVHYISFAEMVTYSFYSIFWNITSQC